MKASFSKILASFLLTQIALFSSEVVEESVISDEELFGEEFADIGPVVQDPLESLNRVIFQINNFLYINVLDPFATGYSLIVPDRVEKSASHFFRNLKYPVRLFGNLLQGEFAGAWVETGRFVINSTVGLAGLFTPADKVEGFQPISAEDIGRALASWGVGEGPYFVVPLLGPSNLRDIIGLMGARVVHPLNEPFSVWHEWEERFASGAAEFTVNSPSFINGYIVLKEMAIDPYSSIRNAYTDGRRATTRKSAR